MSSSPVALALLATAMLTNPPPPRDRLRPLSRRRFPSGVFAPAVAVAAILCAALLSPALAIATTLVCATGAHRDRRRRRARRRRREQRLIAAAVETIVGELRAGAHPIDAFVAAASESEDPVAGTLSAVASRARYGADVSVGLREASVNSAAPDSWERVAVCWNLAAEHGLAMATLMAAAQHDILSRHRFSDTIHAGLSGARATAAILAALPVVGVLLGSLIGAHPVSFLLGGPLGAALLTAGAALMCSGVIWSDRIIGRVAQ